MSDYPGRLEHNTPSWVKSGSLYHIRIRIGSDQSTRLTDEKSAGELLEAARRHHRLGHWWCELFLLMPDHLHVIAAFPDDPGMAVDIKNWKRGTARFQHVSWQSNFFDHRLRSDQESLEKWWYIRRNPVVKGLCTTEDEWRWWCAPAANGLEGGARYP